MELYWIILIAYLPYRYFLISHLFTINDNQALTKDQFSNILEIASVETVYEVEIKNPALMFFTKKKD